MDISTRVESRDRAKVIQLVIKIVNGENVTVRPIRSYTDIPDAVRNRKKLFLN